MIYTINIMTILISWQYQYHDHINIMEILMS